MVFTHGYQCSFEQLFFISFASIQPFALVDRLQQLVGDQLLVREFEPIKDLRHQTLQCLQVRQIDPMVLENLPRLWDVDDRDKCLNRRLSQLDARPDNLLATTCALLLLQVFLAQPQSLHLPVAEPIDAIDTDR